MNVLSRGLTAAACAAALLATAAASASAATHTVRIEGATGTLLAEKQVTVPDSTDTIPGADSACTWNTVAGAVEVATGGNWDRKSFVTTVLGETHTGATDSWFVWANGKYGNGVCFTTLQPNSEILLTAGAFDKDYNPVDLPLTLRDVPARVTPGTPFTVTVDQIQPDRAPEGYYLGDTGTAQPAAGATVTAGGATATVGADGKATLTVSAAGPLTVQAARGTGAARSKTVATCASTGSDGACGTAAATKPASPAAAAKDTIAPKATFTAFGKAKTISAAKAPKLLSGKVDEAGGILMVKLRLTRTHQGRCEAFSAKRERFVRRTKCGASSGWWWSVGDKAAWEYQLPSKLPKGRYVLDAKAIDKAYNRDEERRPGENRVVFEVR